jgi:hypothetical protein
VLSNEFEREALETAFHKVFTEFEFGILSRKLFAESASERFVIYPTSYQLDKPQLKAVHDTMEIMGEDGFYLTILERSKKKIEPENYLFIPLKYWEKYFELPGLYQVLVNAIFSKSGTWGILFTTDFFAFSGGKPEFMEVLKQKWPNSIQKQTINFLKYKKSEKERFGWDIDWVINFTEQLYGKEEAKKYLDAVGIECK